MCNGIVSTDKSVEQWLNNILDEMQKTNRYETKKAIYRYGTEREKCRTTWIMENLGMVCLAANQTWWTAEVEEVFKKIEIGDKAAMKQYLQQQNKQINDSIAKGTNTYTTNYYFSPFFFGVVLN